MRYQNLFNQLKAQRKLAYIPFVLLGDPSEELSFKLIQTLVDNGADALELGFAFSDPVADGPTIQTASLRPLANHFSVEQGFRLIKRVRAAYPELPVGILTYANLVFAPGIEQFYQRAQESGVDSVLIADCPVEESALFAPVAARYGIDSVYIAPPDASDDSLQKIAEQSQGYTYVLSRKGITGTDNSHQETGQAMLEKLKALGAPPLVQGFGISQPEHVYQAAERGVDGIITGSAIVNLINQHYNCPEIMLDLVADYAGSMAQAAHSALDQLTSNQEYSIGEHDGDSANSKKTTTAT